MPLRDKLWDHFTTIIAYALLPITYPLMLWRWRKWKHKRNQEIKKYK